MDSVIVTDNLATYAEIDRVIGTFTDMGDVDVALLATLAL